MWGVLCSVTGSPAHTVVQNEKDVGVAQFLWMTVRWVGDLEHMSSVSGKPERRTEEEQREIPLLYTAAYWEGTGKTEPNSCQRCAVREVPMDTS